MSGNAAPEMMGAAYWHFTVNQLGEEDIAAQVDFIHMTKCNELNEPSSHNTSHTLKKRRHHYRYASHPFAQWSMDKQCIACMLRNDWRFGGMMCICTCRATEALMHCVLSSPTFQHHFDVLQLHCSFACCLHAEHTACMCRVRKSHSDTALSGLEHDSADKPSVLEAFKADGQPGASLKQAVQPQTGLAEQPQVAAAVQVTLEALEVLAI